MSSVIDESNAAASSVDERLDRLLQWLTGPLGMKIESIAPASSDASFRRYFRVRHDGGISVIAMDAPPTQEDCRPFLAVAWLLRDIGLHVPEVLGVNLDDGYLLLGDLGDRTYLKELNPDTVERLYGDAMDALERLQTRGPREEGGLPPYDRAMLLREMQLFPDWLLQRHLGIELDAGERQTLQEAFELLADVALEQPRVCVHRDYHSRNLMVLEDNNPGILDFQDAVLGPITYDLVSLLRDCYIAWPREQVETWALSYLRRPGVRALVGEVDDAAWLRWFDLMGVQRHLKASGIFARLLHRDGKNGYIGDVPRTVGYILQVAADYPELAGLSALLQARVAPRLRGL